MVLKRSGAHISRLISCTKRDKYLVMLVLPVIAYYIIFHYIPMYGVIISFKDYSISKGILGSEWVGLKWFRSLYIGSGIWQSFGWNSIIYLAALSSINPELYEACTIDGAGKWKQMVHIWSQPII